MTADDLDLLRQYAAGKSEDAFTALVNRHLNLVYSAAMRQVGSAQLAEEVAQSVFSDLARSAAKLKPDTIITAWLYEVARRTGIDLVRKESRRQLRERAALEMTAMNSTAADWTQLEPLLDEAMDALEATDRASGYDPGLRTGCRLQSWTRIGTVLASAMRPYPGFPVGGSSPLSRNTHLAMRRSRIFTSMGCCEQLAIRASRWTHGTSRLWAWASSL
jgi:RNA polymerase sigma factor (sigma-70 family)